MVLRQCVYVIAPDKPSGNAFNAELVSRGIKTEIGYADKKEIAGLMLIDPAVVVAEMLASCVDP